MKIVDAKRNDAQLILDFIRKKAAFDGDTKGVVCEVSNSIDRISRLLFGEYPCAKVIIAKNDANEAIGFALYHIRYSSFTGRPSIWLDDLYVDSSKRSQGFGIKMLDVLKDKAGKIEASHIAWTAISFNIRGLNFYDRLGAIVDRVDGDILYYRLDI